MRPNILTTRPWSGSKKGHFNRFYILQLGTATIGDLIKPSKGKYSNHFMAG